MTFVPLPPPPGGLSSAINEGRRRRRQRRAAQLSAAAAGGTAAVVALAMLLTLPGGTRDSLRLPPAVPGVLPSVSPFGDPAGATPAPRPTGTTGAGIAGATSPVPVPGLPERPQGTPPAAAGPSPDSRPRGDEPRTANDYRTPDLIRTTSRPPSAARVCGAAYSSETGGRQLGWCLTASTLRTEQGVDLVFDVCRDGTSSSQLSFATDHEVDLEVLRGDRVVWRWSVGRLPVDATHALGADPGVCWSWRAPWTAVDQEGELLESGSYVLRATSRAQELAQAPETRSSFEL